MPEVQRYPLTQSRFYNLQTRQKLAVLLLADIKEINYLRSADENFIRFKNEAGRDVQWPKPRLRRIQKRAAELLARIEVPHYLHSAVRGRSYITNAKQHVIDQPCVKVDIKQFFQRTRAQAVFHFFRDKLLCAPDVAGILTRLLTVDGHLATGGNVSPILSFFTYTDMFSEIEKLSKSRDCTMTCLMDDITFTGPGASKKLIYDVRRIISRHRLHAHKTKYFMRNQPRVITGVAVTVGGYRLPNKLRAAIAKDKKLMSNANSDEQRLGLLRRAIGRVQAAAQIEPQWHQRAHQLIAQRRELEQKIAAAMASSGTVAIDADA
jgi:RNA-directed DNA polymerase